MWDRAGGTRRSAEDLGRKYEKSFLREDLGEKDKNKGKETEEVVLVTRYLPFY